MKVIELFSSKSGSLGTNLESTMQKSFSNMYLNKSNAVSASNVNIAFYDKNYRLENTFTSANGKWSKSKFHVFNSVSTVKKSTVASATVKRAAAGTVKTNTSCVGGLDCQTTYTIGIWYDLNTLVIVETEVLDVETECTVGSDFGDPEEDPYKPDDSCEQQALYASQNLAAASTASDTEGFDTYDDPTDPFTKAKNPKWTCLKGVGWILSSQEKGQVKLVTDPVDATKTRWEWKSLEHGGISLTGVPVGGSVEPNGGTGTPEVSALVAGMSLNFDVKFSPAYNCPGLNIIFPPFTLNYVSTCVGWTPTPY